MIGLRAGATAAGDALAAAAGRGEVALEGLTKRFDDVVAVDGLDLRVQRGEFFSLLGSSGCGKSTTLRMIAGFETPTSGAVRLDGVDVAALPPNRRDVNTVFQSYALFPHLTVADNVAFGLRRHGVRPAEARARVAEALRLVHLDELAARKPGQLSGGQQQRVALARALVLRPAVLLLDEPLGALDASLRRSLQVELKALQHRVGTTFVYVTHDQDEALAMSDRLAVMRDGRIEQVGSPQAVYEEPRSAFVATFLGVSNLLRGVAVAEAPYGDGLRVRVGELALGVAAPPAHVAPGDAVTLLIRPERVALRGPDDRSANALPALVERAEYRGSATHVTVRLPSGDPVQAVVPNDGAGPPPAYGDAVRAILPPAALRVLEGEG